MKDNVIHSPNRRLALESVFSVANAFVWYFLALSILDRIISENTLAIEVKWIYVLHFVTLAVSLIVGPLLTKKFKRKTLFEIWILLGVISPLALFVLGFAPTVITVAVSIMFAASIGLGMPNCMEYFVRSTETGSRGRYAGLILFISGLGLFLLRMAGSGILLSAILLILWRLLAFVAVIKTKPFQTYTEKPQQTSYKSILSQKAVLLYIVPWLMFSLVNYLTIPIQNNILGAPTVLYFQVIENIIGGAAAVAGGFLMDYIGRKQAAIAGFALLGISYAVLGLYPYEIISWYIYTIIDGISWGILTILFVVSIWGELNQHAPADKYYALGILPFFISKFMQYIFASDVSFDIQPSTIFPFTAFFLFLAVLPLVYAPETLPEKVRKDRDLKSYIENAKKKAQKEADRQKGKTETQKSESKEAQDSSADKPHEEAVKLAEKYY